MLKANDSTMKDICVIRLYRIKTAQKKCPKLQSKYDHYIFLLFKG